MRLLRDREDRLLRAFQPLPDTLSVLRSLLRHAYESVPMYREKYDAAGFDPDRVVGIDDLRLIPLLTKDELRQASLQQLRSTAFDGKARLIASSGSTGIPSRLYRDEESLWRMTAMNMRVYREWCGGKPIEEGLYFIDFAPDSIDFALGDLLRTVVLESSIASVHEPAEALLDLLLQQRPRFISSYPSTMRSLALKMEREGRTYARLEILHCTSEALDAATRRLLRRVFPGVRIVETYTSSEGGLIAWQRHEGDVFQVNQSCVIPEIMPDGTVVITDLTNLSTPIIRYSGMGDLCEWADQSNGTLTALQGRVSDVLTLRDGTAVSPYGMLNALEDIREISQSQIVQHSAQDLEVRVVKSSLATLAPEEVAKALPLPCRVTFVESIPTQQGGHKTPRVLNLSAGSKPGETPAAARQPSNASWLSDVLRGFGQMFLCNNVWSGLLMLAGLAIVSPQHALLGGIGALLMGWLGQPWSRKSGLAAVNGALLGGAWLLFPEVDSWLQLAMTIAGCLFMAALLRVTGRRLVVFSLPSALALSASLAVLMMTGCYTRDQWSGWMALKDGRNAEAARHFEAARPTTIRAQAWRLDGLGWALYRQRNVAAAEQCFEQALLLQPGLTDASIGLGWCKVSSGRFAQADAAFREVMIEAPADAHEGLAWIAMLTHRDDEASRLFGEVRRHLPLLTEPNREGLRGLPVAKSLQRTGARQIASWCLFLIAILIHSRRSAWVVAGMLVLDYCAAMLWPDWSSTFSDVGLLYCQLPLSIALGGLYARWSAGWFIGSNALLILVWPSLHEWSLQSGWAISSLPFNVILITALALMPKRLRVPLEIAITTPEKVRTQLYKTEIARRAGAEQEATQSS